MTINDLTVFYAPRLEAMDALGLLLDASGEVLCANAQARRMWCKNTSSPSQQDVAALLRGDAKSEAFPQSSNGMSPVRETRLRVALPDGAGIRQVDWKCVAIPATDGMAYLTWGKFRTTEGGQEMGFTILADGNIQAVSPMLSAMCGYSQDELVGKPARQFYFSSNSRKRIVSQLQERKEVENGEVTLRRKDGSPLTLWYSAESLRDASGTLIAYSGYFQQRAFEFSLKLANDFSRIVDALPDCAWVCGRDLRIVAANDAYLDAYGRKREEVIGRSEYDFLQPEHAHYLVEAALKVFEEKQEVLLPAVPHLHDARVWLRVIRRPIFDDDRQEVIGLLGIAQDISSKVIRENNFIDQLAGRKGDFVVVTDDQGRILRRSAQTLTPAILGRREPFDAYTLEMGPVLDLLHPDDLPAVRQALHIVMREHREQHFECRIRNQTGNYSTILARLLYNDVIYGEPRVYVVARDISAQIELRQIPLTLERLKEAAGVKTDRELATFLNVSAASISNARKNGRIPPDWLIDAGLRTGHSIDWLVRGVCNSRQ